MKLKNRLPILLTATALRASGGSNSYPNQMQDTVPRPHTANMGRNIYLSPIPTSTLLCLRFLVLHKSLSFIWKTVEGYGGCQGEGKVRQVRVVLLPLLWSGLLRGEVQLLVVSNIGGVYPRQRNNMKGGFLVLAILCQLCTSCFSGRQNTV
jgi:hypothetical protein